MTTEKKQYVITDEKWHELAEAGISKEMLEENDALESFIKGEKTDYIEFNLKLLGLSLEMYATLQLVGPPEEPLLEIINYSEENIELS